MADRARNLFSNVEIAILRELRGKKANRGLEPTKEVSELASSTGVSDNEEILRALYTLEGKALVRPFPEGDFTSNAWEITDVGVKALSMLNVR